MDWVTGFICDDVDEMAKAADRIGEIDPEDCRKHADKFSAQAMCRGYTEVYEALIGRRCWPGSHTSPSQLREMVHMRATPKVHGAPVGARS